MQLVIAFSQANLRPATLIAVKEQILPPLQLISWLLLVVPVDVTIHDEEPPH